MSRSCTGESLPSESINPEVVVFSTSDRASAASMLRDPLSLRSSIVHPNDTTTVELPFWARLRTPIVCITKRKQSSTGLIMSRVMFKEFSTVVASQGVGEKPWFGGETRQKCEWIKCPHDSRSCSTTYWSIVLLLRSRVLPVLRFSVVRLVSQFYGYNMQPSNYFTMCVAVQTLTVSETRPLSITSSSWTSCTGSSTSEIHPEYSTGVA